MNEGGRGNADGFEDRMLDHANRIMKRIFVFVDRVFWPGIAQSVSEVVLN